jgi:gliding motility-associated-like protein
LSKGLELIRKTQAICLICINVLRFETKVYIFDRYGKLLKQIISRAKGWDGTYNGQPLPATDYWFTVDYVEQNVPKQFKAHFSLKR